MKVDARALEAAAAAYSKGMGLDHLKIGRVLATRRDTALSAAITAYLASLPGAGAGEPAEMTDAMMDAGQRYLDGISLRGHYLMPATFNWHEFYRVLLAAAPASPAPASLPSEDALAELIDNTAVCRAEHPSDMAFLDNSEEIARAVLALLSPEGK